MADKAPHYYNEVLEDLGIDGMIVTIDPDSRHLILDFPAITQGDTDTSTNLAEYLIPRLLHHLAVLWHKDKTLQYASDIITRSYNKEKTPLQEGDLLG